MNYIILDNKKFYICKDDNILIITNFVMKQYDDFLFNKKYNNVELFYNGGLFNVGLAMNYCNENEVSFRIQYYITK